jgi:hypothetical protein
MMDLEPRFRRRRIAPRRRGAGPKLFDFLFKTRKWLFERFCLEIDGPRVVNEQAAFANIKSR